MGYEVIYHYKESTDKSGIYKDEILKKNIKIGKINEEVSLEFLANKIISQLARRNILIVDVEIYEYAKKRIRFKESDSGIIIKNKKFNFDKSLKVLEDYQEDEDVHEILQNEHLLEKIKEKIFSENICEQNSCEKKDDDKDSKFANYAIDNSAIEKGEKKNLVQRKRPIREEVYDPEIIVKARIENKGYKFTVGKKYPIYKEKSIGMGILNYLTKDDREKEVEISSECFVVPPVGLSFENEPSASIQSHDDVNLWKNMSVETDMPDIRR